MKKNNETNKISTEALQDRLDVKMDTYIELQEETLALRNEIFIRENEMFSGRFFKIDNKHRVAYVFIRKPVYLGAFDASYVSREHGSLVWRSNPDSQLMFFNGEKSRLDTTEITEGEFKDAMINIAKKMSGERDGLL